MPERELPISRRDFLVRSVKRGIAVAGAVAAAGVAGNFYGTDQERKKHLPPGEGRISPELRKKLEDAGYFIYEPRGETIASMRNANLAIPLFPLTVPEGQPDPETVPSEHKWIAFKLGEFYLSSEEGATPKDLGNLVSRQSSTVRRFDSGLQFVPGKPIDLFGLDHAYILGEIGRESLFSQAGFVITGTKIGNNGVAIGRSAPGEPLGYSIFDTSTQNPIPPPNRLLAVGVVVASK